TLRTDSLGSRHSGEAARVVAGANHRSRPGGIAAGMAGLQLKEQTVKIAAICCTYKRPTLLAEAIECFIRQDYPAELRELIVLDGAGEYGNLRGDGLRVVSLPVQFLSLAELRHASSALVWADADAYCVRDDDAIYLPWHMTAAAAAMAEVD